jgi:N-methylhydantoinase B
VREYELLEDGIEVSLWLERSKLPAWGLFGGADGAPTRGEIEVGGTVDHVTKVNARRLPRGARVRVMTGGGGGYGPPEERPAELVEDDLTDGYVA